MPPLEIAPEWVEQVRAQVPELPDAKRTRFETEFGLSAYDADQLTREKSVALYFEQARQNAEAALAIFDQSQIQPKT